MKNEGFQTEDLYPRYAKFFSVDVRIKFCYRHTSQLWEYDELQPNGTYLRKIAAATFIGFTTTKKNRKDAASIIASKINQLEKLGYLKGTLAPLVSLELARDPVVDLSGTKVDNTFDGETKHVLLSYIFVTAEGSDWLKNNVPHLLSKEGAVPNALMN